MKASQILFQSYCPQHHRAFWSRGLFPIFPIWEQLLYYPGSLLYRGGLSFSWILKNLAPWCLLFLQLPLCWAPCWALHSFTLFYFFLGGGEHKIYSIGLCFYLITLFLCHLHGRFLKLLFGINAIKLQRSKERKWHLCFPRNIDGRSSAYKNTFFVIRVAVIFSSSQMRLLGWWQGSSLDSGSEE